MTAVLTPVALGEALVAAGLVLELVRPEPEKAGGRAGPLQLLVRPRSAVTPAIAGAIRAHKPQLVAAFLERGEGPWTAPRPAMTPVACSTCRYEFVPTSGERCAWCAVVAGREVSYRPNSAAERAFLDALQEALAAEEAGRSVSGPTGHTGHTGHTSSDLRPTIAAVPEDGDGSDRTYRTHAGHTTSDKCVRSQVQS